MSDRKPEISGYDTRGQLPPGIYEPTLGEFRERYVGGFPTSTKRSGYYNGYLKYCSMICKLGVHNAQWIDGSYITNKIDPGDIDIIVEFDAFKFKELSDTDKKTFLIREAAEAAYHCHAFPVPVFPEEDPRYVATKDIRDHWIKWFTRDRDNNDKGIIYFYQLSPEYLEELTKEVERR